MNQIKELQENIEYWESVKHDTKVAINHQKRRYEKAEKEIQLNRARLEELSPLPVEGPAPITGKNILQDLGAFFIRVPLKNPIYIEEAAVWLEDYGFKHNEGLTPDELYMKQDHIRGHNMAYLQCDHATKKFRVLPYSCYGCDLGELPEAKYYVRNRVETRNKERAKQLQHGQQLAERLRSLADSVEASGVVDVRLNFNNTGLTPLLGSYDGNTRWLDSGSRHMELDYRIPKN